MKRKPAGWAFALFGLLAGGLFLPWVRFSTQVLELLPSNLPAVQALKLYEHFFLQEHRVVVLVEVSQPIDRRLFVKAIQALCQRPGPLRNLQVSAQNRGGDAVAQAAGLLSLPSGELESLIQAPPPPEPAKPPVGVSPTFILLEAVLTTGTDRVSEARGWIRDALDRVSIECEIPPGILRGEITGNPVFAHDIQKFIRQQLLGTLLFTIITGIIAGWALTRDLRPFQFMVGMSCISVAGTLLLLQIVFGSVNGVAVAFSSLLFGMAVDYAILVHFGAHEEREQPWHQRRLIRGLLGGWSTTAVVFALLATSTFPGMRQLGAGVAIGLTICMGGSILWGVRQNQTSREPSLQKMPEGLLRWLQTWRVAILSVLVVTCFAGVLGLFWQPGRFTDFSARRIQPSIPAQQTLDHLEELAATHEAPFFLLVGPGDLAAVRNRLAAIQGLLTQAENEKILSRSVSPDVPTLAGLESNLKICKTQLAESRNSRLPIASEKADVFSNEEENWHAVGRLIQDWVRLPAGEVLKAIFVRHPLLGFQDGQYCLLVPVWAGSDREAMAAGWLSQRFAQSSISQVHVVSWPFLTQQLGEVAVRQFGKMAALGLLLVLAILGYTFKSWSLLIRTLICQFFSVLLACGLLWLLHIPWTLMSLPVLVMVFGVSVDYYIHLGLAARETGRLQFAQTHLAVSACALTTLASFAALALLGGPGLGNLGAVGFVMFAVQTWMALGVFPFWGKEGRYQDAQPF